MDISKDVAPTMKELLDDLHRAEVKREEELDLYLTRINADMNLLLALLKGGD